MLLSVLLITIFALCLISIGTEAYGSIQGTNQCDPSVNQSCPQSSQIESMTEYETGQTPLIVPNLSPTREDLDYGQTDESATTADSNNNDDVMIPTSTDSDDGDTTENNADDNSDDEQKNGDSSEEDDDGKDSGDGPSMIPFP